MLKHKFFLRSLLLLEAVLPFFGLSLAAQDLTLDLTKAPRTEEGVQLQYHQYVQGANIYAYETTTTFLLEISSTKNILRIEFEGTTSSDGGVIVSGNNGTLDFQPKGTSVWEGKSKNIVFAPESSSTDYYIPSIRIWFEGSADFCEAPTIAYEGGQFTISSTTPGATCHYNLTPNATQTAGTTDKALPLQTFTLSAHAEAEGKKKSPATTVVLTLDELLSGSIVTK
ncbi:MAG: hypothetical protein KBS75_06350 [Bacteroidales bacterium]|nr:hypothetical protein [Candidatus Equimonas faecalis]